MTSQHIHSVYQSRKVILDLMKKQGYDIEEYESFSISEISAMLNSKQLDMFLEKKDSDTFTTSSDRIYICYSQYPRLTANDIENTINAPKNIQRLEEISVERNMQRKIEEMADEDDDNVKLKIFGDELKLDNLDIQNIGFPELKLESNLLLNDIEILT